MTGTMDASAPDLQPYALYRYWDARDALLYIGITGDLAVRDSGHISRSRWMQLVARSAVERLKTIEDVRAAERTAIETEQPLFNVQYNDTPEAKERLRAYLAEIGRLDLLYAKQPPARRTPVAYSRPERSSMAEDAAESEADEYPDLRTGDPEEDAYLQRWRWEAAVSWWRPWWEENRLAPDDLLEITCPEYGVTEAIGMGLAERRRGRSYPLAWVTQLPDWSEPVEFNGRIHYQNHWSAHADLTFGSDEVPGGLTPGEAVAQRRFAETLATAGRCSSFRLGDQPVLIGFKTKTEAQIAGTVLRHERQMLECAQLLRRHVVLGCPSKPAA